MYTVRKMCLAKNTIKYTVNILCDTVFQIHTSVTYTISTVQYISILYTVCKNIINEEYSILNLAKKHNKVYGKHTV